MESSSSAPAGAGPWGALSAGGAESVPAPSPVPAPCPDPVPCSDGASCPCPGAAPSSAESAACLGRSLEILVADESSEGMVATTCSATTASDSAAGAEARSSLLRVARNFASAAATSYASSSLGDSGTTATGRWVGVSVEWMRKPMVSTGSEARASNSSRDRPMRISPASTRSAAGTIQVTSSPSTMAASKVCHSPGLKGQAQMGSVHTCSAICPALRMRSWMAPRTVR